MWGYLGVLYGGDKPVFRSDSRAGDGYVIEFNNNPIQKWFGFHTTYGNVICYANDPSPDKVAHELAHTRQYKVLRDLYLPAHIALQIYSSTQTSTYNEGNFLEIGPYRPKPIAWPCGVISQRP